MSAIIQVKDLSKSFIISHEGQERYTTLRDVVANKAKKIFSFSRPSNAHKKSTSTKEEFWALKDVSFEIEKGDRVGIIGRNGAGKSTLLKILSRITEPTSGEIRIKGRVASLLEVGTGFHPELTGRENIFLNGAILGMSRAEIRKKFDEIVAFAEVEKFLDTPVKRYSSGMYVRLAFAVAAHLEPEILVVDEVLAVGDAQFQKKCLGKMEDVSKNEGRTVLFVSHNMATISDLCNKGIFLSAGKLDYYGTIEKTIGQYISNVQSNKIYFDKFLKYVEFYQESDKIIVEAEYDCPFKLDLPNLGFVIKNSLGIPIVGANPFIKLYDSDYDVIHNNAGFIKATMYEPKLLDGIYTVSIWFGDSKEEFLVKQDCLTFEVAGMSKLKQLIATKVGSAIPKCEWEFK